MSDRASSLRLDAIRTGGSRALELLPKFLFGDDIFISYTRADAVTYAAGLASQLTARDFSCFLDQWGAPPGREIPGKLKRALRRGTIFVLIGSEGAIRSQAVAWELKEFRKSGRTIVPIDFGGALERAPWFDQIAGLARTAESVDALKSGDVSPHVLARIEKSFQFTRRNQRARRAFGIAAIGLLTLAATSVYTMKLARDEATRAEEQEAKAEENRVKAVEQTGIAERNREEAARKAEEALAQAKIAEQQERFARSRALAASASAQLTLDPADSLKLAEQAWTTEPTDEARLALRDALLQSHLRFVVADHSGTVNASSFSSDGKLVVVAAGNTAKILDVMTGTLIAELRGHTKPVQSAGFSPVDDGLVVTAAGDLTARIWRWRAGGVPVVLEEQGPGIQARFSPDGRFVIITTQDHNCIDNYEGASARSSSRARTWDLQAGAWVGSVLGGTCLGRGRKVVGAPIDPFTPDGRFVFHTCPESATRDDPRLLQDVCTGSHILDLVNGQRVNRLELSAWLVEAAVSERAGLVIGRVLSREPQRRRLQDTRVHVWDLATGAAVTELDTPSQLISLSSDGQLLVTSYDRNVYLWRLTRGEGDHAMPARLSPSAALSGHTGRIAGIAVSGDDRFVLTAAEDGTVRVWDVATSKTVAVLRGHTAGIQVVAMSPDRRSIVTSGADGTARFWSAGMAHPIADVSWTEGEVLTARFTAGASIAAVDGSHLRTWHQNRGELRSPDLPGTIKAVSRDAATMMLAAPDDSAAVFTTSGQRLVRVPGQGARFRSAAFAADGGTIVTSSEAGGVSLWNAASGEFIRRLREPGSVDEIHASADGSRIVTAALNGPTIVWDGATGERIAPLGDRLGRARLSPDGRLVLTFDREPVASLWDVGSRARLVDLKGNAAALTGHQQRLLDGSFSRDGRRVVTIDPYAVIVWTLSTPGEQSLTAIPVALNRRAANAPGVVSAMFSPDGKRVLTTHATGPALLWDAATGNALLPLKADDRAAVGSAAFSSDGRVIATLSADGTIRLWSAEAGRLLHTLRADARDLVRIGFSPNSSLVVAGTSRSSNQTFIWRVASGKQIGRLRGHDPVPGPRSDRVLTINHSDTAQVWQAGRTRRLAELEGFSIVRAEFSEDGHYLLTVTTDLARRVWDARTGKLLATLPGQAATSAAFVADGTSILTAGEGATSLLWEWRRNVVTTVAGLSADALIDPRLRSAATSHVTTNRPAFTQLWSLPTRDGRSTITVPGPIELTGRLASFSPDGAQLLTIGDDQTVRVWQSAGGRLIAELRGHAGAIRDASFSPDGRYVATASEDRSARVWEASTGALISELLGHSGGVTSAAFSPDGTLVLTRDTVLRVFACVICGTGDELLTRARERAGVVSTPSPAAGLQTATR